MAEPAKHFTVRSLAEHWNVAVETIYRLVNNAEIGVLRIGAAIRIPRIAVEAYEEAHFKCPEPNNNHRISSSDESTEEKTGTYAGQKIVGLDAFQRAQQMKRQQSECSQRT